MTNLEALELYGSLGAHDIDRERAYQQLRRALEALDAVEVLDHHGDYGVLPGPRVNTDLSVVTTEDTNFYGDDPHAARIAAAAAVREEG